MTNNNYYQIAGHQICVSAEPELLTLMTNYEPFAVSPQHPTIKLEIFNSYQRLLYTEEYRQTENGQTIICGHSRDNHPVFEFAWHNDITGLLICANDYSEAKLQITRQHLKATIDTAMMILFALGTASQATVLPCCHHQLPGQGLSVSWSQRHWQKHTYTTVATAYQGYPTD